MSVKPDPASVTAIAVDLDGTILGPGSVLSDRVARSLRACLASGRALLLATGRSPVSAEKYRAAVGATGPMVFYNGAAVIDVPSGKTLASRLLAAGAAAVCVAAARRRDAHFHAFLPGDALVFEKFRPETELYRLRTGLGGSIVDFDSLLAGEAAAGVVKGLFIADRPVLESIAAELSAALAGRIYLTYSQADYLEVMAAGVSKGAALTRALELRGLDPAGAVAFGDAENDVPMLEAAGWGVAMGNAAPAAAAAADDRCPPVSEDGVAVYLEALFGF